ncbi:hypothetical protein AOL_s00075g97 [Orbilia oligospora ATCC 24927]|uniref:ORP1 like protein n=1 Tax=Arthrobotrys oligospora (strain ATCC 24927 / CBS 115.81 / DSM 1491) TaxID=756982 RepID=G1X898_ARTOA|nr:hypothetical protein AOL_s00075g97 [Orbilia oligospora ATCC 24927]EGX50671.1 hypothetical protein AOL_s00075g97 [Orbilia oligospora ATCC 24927]
MDIKSLLNPSAKGAINPPPQPHDIVEEDPIRSTKSSSTSSKVSRHHATPRSQNDDHARYHKYATVGSSSAGSMTARSSISSLSSFQSSNSLTSLTTSSSAGSISKGSLGSPIHESLGRPKPDFRIPIYAFDITQNSARLPPRGLYTPSESDYSPSTTAMTQYFPSHPDVTQDRIAREEIPGSNLTTLAALATCQDFKRNTLESDYFDARYSYGPQHSPYEGTPTRSYVTQIRQRTDLIPKQVNGFGHISTQDVYAMSKLQLSGTPSTLSPTSTIGPSGSTTSIVMDLFSAPKCSYVEDCNTGSPLRKVVSHIFGRNKLSTRQIPKNIWVYYCRKHYQRSRYRDPKGFAKLQCELVRRQVERLNTWGGVEDWVIKVRRREELRISKENKTAAPYSPDASDDFEDEYGRRDSVQGSSDIHWISLMTGNGKSVDDVRFLLGRVEAEIIDRGGIFPDVEILPNVRPSAISGDMNSISGVGMGEIEGLGPVDPAKPKKSRGSLLDVFSSPRKLPSRKSLEEAMVVTGSTVAAQAKLQKSSRPSFIQEYSPPSLDDEDSPSPTRPKRKASKPLPITVLSPQETSYPEACPNYGYSQMPALREADSTAETEKMLLKYRSKRPRPGVGGFPDYQDHWDEFPSPVSTRRHSLELESDMPSLPLLAERLEEQLRSPSMEDPTLGGLPFEPAKATGEAFCSFEQKDLKIVLVTPPPSACGDYSRGATETLETTDGEFSQLGVTQAQPLLAIDPESARTVLAVEVPQHVRDFVMGSWSRKRAVRMKNLFGDQIARPTESRLLGYRPSRRRGSPPGKSPLTRRVGGQAQDYVELAKESVRSGVRQLRTSFALQSEPMEESVPQPSNRKSFSLLSKPNPNYTPTTPTSSSKRRHRASSAGPAGRSSSSNMSMRRTMTTTPAKGAQEQSRTWARSTSGTRLI